MYKSCENSKIIAGRLTSMRNIYLREELRNIAKQIQAHYKERLPILSLVSLAAYEQIFQRQPLCLPEQLRQDAVKYGLKYYKLHIEKLRIAEANNGLCPVHDRLSCFDKNCPLHQTDSVVLNSNRSKATSVDQHQTKTTDSQSSLLSLSDTSSDASLHSSNNSDTSNQSTTTTQTSRSTRTLSHVNIPKIMISQTSDSNSASNDSDNSSTTIDNDRTWTDTDSLTVPDL